MCRNIRTLFNFEPPATDEEVRAASVQFVRKLSGFHHPSKANEEAFARAVEETAAVARRLVDSPVTASPARACEGVAALAKARSARRFGKSAGGLSAARGPSSGPAQPQPVQQLALDPRRAPVKDRAHSAHLVARARATHELQVELD